MSLHRVVLFGLALLFTDGMTSMASAGCGGCGTPTVYTVRVAQAPVTWHRWHWRTWAWGTGCGCHRGLFYAATPTITLTPIAPAPIYVVNQGPDYTGPGITVPYHLWTTGSYIVLGTYPYYWRHYGYGHWYWHHAAYHQHFYGHNFYHWRWHGMHHWHH